MKFNYSILFTLLVAVLWLGCDETTYEPIGDDDVSDDDAADDDTGDDDVADDDAQGDDDDAQGDDDDAQGDDDDAQGDDDDAQGDDDDTAGQGPCADQGGVTLTFAANPPITTCNTTWTEAGAELIVVQGGPCPNGCYTDVGGYTDDVGLYPGQLQIDVSGVGCEVTEVTAVYSDWGGNYHAYDSGMTVIDSGNLSQGQNQTTVMGTLGGQEITHIHIGGCESAVHEVTLM